LVCDIKGTTQAARVFKEGALRKISGPKGDEIIGGWRKKLHK
jgi:hypothetical protein